MHEERAVDHASAALCLTAVGLCIAPFSYFAAAHSSVFPSSSFALILTSVSIITGYFLQALAALVVKRKRIYRESDEYDVHGFYDRTLALFPRIVYIAIAFAASRAYDRYVMINFSETYDRYSAVPWLIGLSILAITVIGGLIWFYPPSIVLSKDKIIVYMILFFIGYAAVSAISKKDSVFSGACFALFFVVYILFSTQNSLTDSFIQSGISSSSGNARVYNLSVSVFTIMLFILLSAVSYGALTLIIRGVVYVFRIITGKLVYSVEDGELTDPTKLYIKDGYVYDPDSEQFRSTVIATIVSAILRIVIPLFFIIGVIFILTRTDLYKKIFLFFGTVLASIFAFFRSLFDLFGSRKTNNEKETTVRLPDSYSDKEKWIEQRPKYRSTLQTECTASGVLTII